MTPEAVNIPVPAITLSRDQLVIETVDAILAETRDGPTPQLEAILNREQLIHAGALKAGGAKIADIHDDIIDMLGGNKDDAPSYRSLARWMNRFSHRYSLIRAAERAKLAEYGRRQQMGEADAVGREATYGLHRLAEMVNDTISDLPDLRDLTNGQLANLGGILTAAAKAARDERKLDAAIDYTEQRTRLVELRNSELESKLEAQRTAAEQARAKVEAMETAGEKQITPEYVYGLLDDILRGEVTV